MPKRLAMQRQVRGYYSIFPVKERLKYVETRSRFTKTMQAKQELITRAPQAIMKRGVFVCNEMSAHVHFKCK